MSSTNSRSDSHYPNSPPPPGARHCGRFPGSRRSEPERLSDPTDQRLDAKGSNGTDDEYRQLCMKKLSEFTESLRRQGQSTSTRFQWDHLFRDDSGKKAAAAAAAETAVKPEPAMQKERIAATYSMSPMGFGLMKENLFVDSNPPQLKEINSGFGGNGEDFRYPDVGEGSFSSKGEAFRYPDVGNGSFSSNGKDFRYPDVGDGSFSSKGEAFRYPHVGEGSFSGNGKDFRYPDVGNGSFSSKGEAFRYPDVGEGGFSGNGEDFRYPDVGNRSFSSKGEAFRYPDVGEGSFSNNGDAGQCGALGEEVGFDGYGEKLGFDSSSSVISEMAMNRMRRIEEITKSAYRKMESLRARASAVDSIVIHQIDHAEENRGVGLDHCFPLPQEYMSEQKQKGAALCGERHQLGEDGSHHSLTQRYGAGFGAQGEEVVGVWMNHSQSVKGALFHGERQQAGEDCGRVLRQLYPDLKEKSPGNEMELGNNVAGCWMHHAQDHKGGFVHNESQQFQHYIHSKRKNEDLGSWRNCRQGESRASLPDERQEFPGDYDRSLPQSYFDFGRESRVMEQRNEVLSPCRMSGPQAQEWAHLTGGRQCLAEDYDHSLPQHFDVQSHVTHQDNELLFSPMANPQKPKGASFNGENQQLREDCDNSLPRHHLGLSGESHVEEQEDEVLDSGMNHPQDQRGAIFNDETQQLPPDCALGSPLPKQDDNLYSTEGITEQISMTEQQGINTRSLETHPKKRIIDLRKIKESQISALTNISASNDEEEQVLLIRKSGYQSPQDERTFPFDELPSQRKIIDYDSQFSLPVQEFGQPSNRNNIKQRLGLPRRNLKPSPCRKNVMQRLGQPCQVHSDRKNVMQRLGQPYQVHSDRKNVMRRLGSSCQVRSPNCMLQVKRPSMNNVIMKKNVDEFHREVQSQDVQYLPVRKCRRTEPPESAKEFERLVHGAFLQFVKVLNENPAQRRKYTEKRKAETLKCFVCGSKSKDFFSMISLAEHAFTSQMAGLRVHHLGLHKALCLLMEWKSTPVFNDVWRPRRLPDAEALAMKEDLVIWPPVVILHNSSIATTNSNDWIIVSIEELEAFLRDMGFGKGISKVCRGKAANQSTMTVVFDGMFSGLKEAERLHKLFAENKHGRAEFLQINCSSGGAQKVPVVNKVKDVVYGYLGIACDLHVLDFQTKSRALVKSKKDIYAMAS